MNVYAWIVLVALVGEFILSIVTSVLNVRAMSPTVPDEFRATYDDDAYARSQSYTRTQSWFGLVQGLVSLVTLQSRLMAAMSLCAHLVVVCRSRVVHCRCTVVAARRCPVVASLWRHLTPFLVAAARCLSRLARHQAVPVGPSLSRAVGLLVAMRVLSSCPSARVRLVPAVLSP